MKVHFHVLCVPSTLVLLVRLSLLSFSDSPDVGQAFVISAGGGRKAELLEQSLPLHRGFAG